MEVSGHGRVKSVAVYDNGQQYLKMDWSDQKEIIEVPLMACHSTVNVKAMDVVEDNMPQEFFEWLES
jgi:hypothetical protein